MCVCVYIYMYIYLCICLYMCIFLYMFLYVYIYVYLCVHIYLYICLYMYTYTYIYKYIYMTLYIYIYIYVCIYRYYTITSVCTTALLPTKPSSDDDSIQVWFRGRSIITTGPETPVVYHDTTRLFQIAVTLWDCHIHANAVRTLYWILSMYILLSDGGSPRLVKNAEVELAMKPLHPISIGSTFFVQPYLTHFFLQILIFFQLTLMCPVEIFFKRER